MHCTLLTVNTPTQAVGGGGNDETLPYTFGQHTGLLPHYRAVIDANMSLDSSFQPQQAAAPATASDDAQRGGGTVRSERTARG